MAGRWTKLYGKITEWGWYKDGCTARVFFHLLVTVNYKASEWKGVTINRGECVTSIPQLSQELGLTAKQIRRALENLISTGEIASRTNNHYRIITVSNYGAYQSGPDEADSEPGQTAGQTKGRPQGRPQGQQKPQHNEANNDNEGQPQGRPQGRPEIENRADRRAALIESNRIYNNSLSSARVREGDIPSPSPEPTPAYSPSIKITDAIFRWSGGLASPLMVEDVGYWVSSDRADEDLVLEAIDAARRNGNKNWDYVRGIMRNFHANGYATLAAYRQAQAQRRPPSAGNGYSKGRATAEQIEAAKARTEANVARILAEKQREAAKAAPVEMKEAFNAEGIA